MTQKTSYPKEYGTRHRAGIGITEVANVMSLVVSEETGRISVAQGDKIISVTTNELEHDYLAPAFGITFPNK